MRTDSELIRDDVADALARSAERLDARARTDIRHRVMGTIRRDERTRFFASVAHRVATAAAVIGLLGGGVAYAANAAMPGDQLYPLKRGAEDALVTLLPPGALRHSVLVGIAERRAHEAAWLATEGATTGMVDETLSDLREAVAEAASREGTLAGEDAARIQEHGQYAPTPTREAIDSAVTSSGGTSSGSDNQISPTPGTSPGVSETPMGGGSMGDPGAPGSSNETTGGAGYR